MCLEREKGKKDKSEEWRIQHLCSLLLAMFASKTSHKRRRSSARGDASRAAASSSRAIVTVAGMGGGEEAEEGEPSWAWKRLERVVESHAINHCVRYVPALATLCMLNLDIRSCRC